ncbi:MAG: cytochrome c biogenesis protein ResB [Deltaproteobacteria bacterium]|nr:cytochrome c biogenesis protein ResB [Deltaproteobacteria bacterium]
MKAIWRFFASIKLTIVLAALICIVAAYGSVLAVRNQEFYRYLDRVILLPWLADKGATYFKLTGWIFALIILTAVFAVNTVVCTVDRLYAVIKRRLPASAFFPQIVHIGFLIALLGHLAGTVAGYKSDGNILYKDVPVPVPHEQGLSMRLDDVEVRQRPDKSNDISFVRTRVTLLSGNETVKTGEIGINNPLIYKGVAFYHIDAGKAPAGLVLEAEGRRYELGFNAALRGETSGPYAIGTVYPDFAIDPSGRPSSRSEEFRNPYIEVSGRGKKGYLFIGRPGSSVNIAGRKVSLADYIYAPYVILNINKDPGIWLIIAGSAVLTIGMLLLLFLRGERAELVSRRPGARLRNEEAGE